MALETIIASVVLPAILDIAKDGAKALGRRVSGISVDDQVKLETAQLERLKALATLDNPHGVPSQWVVDTRGVYRYASATLVMLIGLAITIYGISKSNQVVTFAGLELIGTPFGFIFGERLWMGLKGPGHK